jgi:hypothetical protein
VASASSNGAETTAEAFVECDADESTATDTADFPECVVTERDTLAAANFAECAVTERKEAGELPDEAEEFADEFE